MWIGLEPGWAISICDTKQRILVVAIANADTHYVFGGQDFKRQSVARSLGLLFGMAQKPAESSQVMTANHNSNPNPDPTNPVLTLTVTWQIRSSHRTLGRNFLHQA